MHTKTLLTLPLILALASPVLARDDKAMLAKCDFDRNGTINGGGNDLPPAAWTMSQVLHQRPRLQGTLRVAKQHRET